jgi:hypothetical protein
MPQQMRADIAKIADLINTADISEEQKRAAVWCIKKLPDLYDQLCQTYESRYGDEIRRLEKGVFLQVRGISPDNSQAQGLVAKLTARLNRLHERLGFPLLDPKPVSAPRSRKAK